MRGITAALCVAVLAGSCAERSGPAGGGAQEVTFEELTGRPEAFDGRTVDVEAGYYGAFEVSVLTSGFAESYPPQPMEPAIWVAATPPRGCLQRAQGVSWAESVRAAGTFRYDPENGFGHLGAYDMTLENVDLTCASE